jgi:hypothetical protein
LGRALGMEDEEGGAAPESSASAVAVATPSRRGLVLERPFHGRRRFEVDVSLGPQSTQSDVASDGGVGLGALSSALLSGRDAMVLAYGPTGAGKTHTVFGPSGLWARGAAEILASEARGLVPRALQCLFAAGRALSGEVGGVLSVRAAFFEVYLDTVTDLLEDASAADADALAAGSAAGVGAGRGVGEAAAARRRLEVERKVRRDARAFSVASSAAARRASRAASSVAVVGNEPRGLCWVEAATADELVAALRGAIAKRSSGSTESNEHSSRSHAVLWVDVQVACPGKVSRGRWTLVDLAGSERLAKSRSAGLRADEARAINRSVAALGNVVAALAANRPHVPFRDDTLTRILQPSLAGGALVCVVTCVAPAAATAEETLGALLFAQRAREAKLGPVAVHVTLDAHLSEDHVRATQDAVLLRARQRAHGRKLLREAKLHDLRLLQQQQQQQQHHDQHTLQPWRLQPPTPPLLPATAPDSPPSPLLHAAPHDAAALAPSHRQPLRTPAAAAAAAAPASSSILLHVIDDLLGGSDDAISSSSLDPLPSSAAPAAAKLLLPARLPPPLPMMPPPMPMPSGSDAGAASAGSLPRHGAGAEPGRLRARKRRSMGYEAPLLPRSEHAASGVPAGLDALISPSALRAPSPLRARRNARLADASRELESLLLGTRTGENVAPLARAMMVVP